MGWAAGFRAGTDMSNQWLNTYRDAERRRLLQEAQQDKPIQQFTAAQGDELRRLSELTDPEGRRMYDISITPGSTEYQVRPVSYGTGPLRGEYTPDFGSLPPPSPSSTMYAVPTDPFAMNPQGLGDTTGVQNFDGPREINPRGLSVGGGNFSGGIGAARAAPEDTAAYRGLMRQLGDAQRFAPAVTSYLGQTYEGNFTPEMQRAALMNRYADIIGREDPIKGEELRMSAERYARETKDYNEQQDIKKGRREEVKRLQGLKPDELVNELGAEFSKDGSGIDAMLTYDPKSKQFLFASNVPGMPSQVLSRAELIQYAMGVWEQGNGDYGAGLKQVIDTVKAQREIGNTNYTRAADLAGKSANLGLKLEDLANDRQRTAAIAARDRSSRIVNVGVDENNRPIFVDPNQLQMNPDGTVRLPDNVQGLRQPQQLSDVDKLLLGKALDVLETLPEDASQAERDNVFRRFGLDPKRFGGSGGLAPAGRFGGQ